MPLPTKRTVLKLMQRYPLHWVIPPGDLRSCATIVYHSKKSAPETTVRYIKELDVVPTRYLRPAVTAARSAFHIGNDDAAEVILAALEERFPEACAVHVLRSDLDCFYGRYEDAFNSAGRARLLRPADPAAAARQVKLAYRLFDRPAADQIAIAAVRRFPRTSEILWAACKACSTPEQRKRIQAIWDALDNQPPLHRVVRPLATAAARAGEMQTATDLYLQAIRITFDGVPVGGSIAEPTLDGRRAWQAIEDICEVLDDAVPYFFAAGTALGLVRAGGPLGADGDIDVGIFDSDWDRTALLDRFARHPRFDFEVIHPDAPKLGLRHRGGSPVDVFRFYEDGGLVWHDAVFVRWHNTPFKVTRKEVRGLQLPLPDDPDRYLTECYGDWQTPNSAFDAFTDDAPNVETTWPEYLKFHYVRRAYKSLAAGDPGAAANDLDRADEGQLAAAVRNSN